MAKLNGKGRSRDSRHVRLYGFMTSSAAWLDLSGNAVKLLVYLATLDNGTNNGELFASERSAGEAIGVSKRTAGKLFDELETHGFIQATVKGYFSTQRAATRWRLTWLPWAGKGPTSEWRGWRPEQNLQAKVLHDTGEEIAPVSTIRRTTGEEIAPIQPCLSDPLGEKCAPHTVAIGDALSSVVRSLQIEPEMGAGRSAARS